MASVPLIRNGISYVTAKAAAPAAGISADYITKLCRKGEVDAVVVGATWYVNEASLADFIARKEVAKKAQAERNAQQLREATRRGQATHIQHSVPRGRRRPTQVNPAYVFSIATILLLVAMSAGMFAFSSPNQNTQILAAAAATLPAPIQQTIDRVATNVFNFFCPIFSQCSEQTRLASAPSASTGTLASQRPQPTASSETASRILDESASHAATPQTAAIAQPPTIIQRIIERTQTGITEQLLDARLAALETHLTGLVNGVEFRGDRQAESLANSFADGIGGGGFDDIDISNSTISGSSFSGGSISGASLSGITFTGAQSFDALFVADATTTNATSTNLYVSGSFGFGSDTGLLRNTAGVVDTLANGTNGQVLKIVGGALQWSADLTGGGGGSGAWATTSNSLALHPADPGKVVLVGDTATSTTDTILEVMGNSLFKGTATIYGLLTAPYLTATSSTASSFPYASTTALSAMTICLSADCITAWPTFTDTSFSTTSAEYWKSLSNFFSTTSNDYWSGQRNFFSTTSADFWESQQAPRDTGFSTTSADYWKSVTDFFSTTSAQFLLSVTDLFSTSSASHFLAQNQGAAFSTTSASYFLSQNGSLGFSTTSADYWQSQRNFFSTSSALHFASAGLAFSTSSSDFWQSQRSFFATTSSDYWLTQRNLFSTTSADTWKLTRNFFSTTSADYWRSVTDLFSTSSASYFVSVNQGSLFSTTSAIHFVHSSTTIPKTYTANAFTALQSFNAGLALPSLTNSLLATDGSGNVIATSTLASSLLSLPSGYTFRGNTSNLAEATSTLFVASSGNVGVGTTSPSQRLDVNGIIQTNNYFRSVRAETIGQPAFVDLNNSSGQSLTLKYAEEAISAIPADVWQFRIGGATRDILFSLFDSTPLLMIKGNGNVGIGTTTPDNKLNVQGNIFAGNTTDGVVIRESGNIGEVLGINSALNSFNDLYIRSNSASGIYLNTSGSVGIGTTTPSAKLEISDSLSQAVGATLTNTSTGTGALTRLFLRNDGSTGGGQLQVGGTGYTGIASWQDSLVLNSDSVLSGGIKIRAATGGIKLSASGTEANDFYINSSGSVGIGTTSPSAKFEIGDNSTGGIQAFITNSNSATNSYAELTVRNDYNTFNNVGGLRLVTLGTGYASSGIFAQDTAVIETGTGLSGGLNIGTAASAPLGFFTGGTSASNIRMTIDSSGLVGIGTTTPNGKLTINTGSGGTNLSLERTSGQVNRYSFDITSTGTGVGGALNLKADYADGAIGLRAAASGDDQLVLLSSGNLGIGTTSPSQALEVVGTARVTNSTQFGGLHVHNGTNLIADIKGFAAGNDNGVLQLYNGGTISARVMASGSSYFNGGNIGIGTTTPDTALTIHNASVPNANGQNVLKLQGAITAGTIGSGPRIVFTSTGASSGLEVADIRAYTFGASNTGLTFGTGGGGTITTRMAIDGSGNVGIGTTSPWKTLSVVGTMSVNGLTLNTGAASASLCLSSSNEVTRNTDNESCITSSARYKHDIQSLVGTTTLSTLLALRPVSFEYNETPGIRYGLIAEEVDAIDPTLVGYDDEGKPNSVRYTSVIPLLIQAVQEITNITGQSKQNLIAWLADAQNGITDLFAKHLHAENITADTGTFGTVSADRFEGQEVCAKASGGSLVCLTADQFAAMLSQFAGAAAATSGASSPSNIPTPPAQNPEQEDGQTDDATASETNNTTTQNPSPDSAPDLTDSAQSPAANWTPEEPANDNNPSPDASGDSPPPVSNAPGSTPSSTAGTASSPTVANDNAPSPTESAI